MKKSVLLLGVAAFGAFTAALAHAIEDSSWGELRVKIQVGLTEVTKRPVKRTATKQFKNLDGFLQVSASRTDFTGGPLSADPFHTFTYVSPAVVNGAGNATVSDTLLEDAQDAELTPDQMAVVSALQSGIASAFNPPVSAKAKAIDVRNITITKLRVRGKYIENAAQTRITGVETFRFEGVIQGGDDDGMSVKGKVKIQLAGSPGTS